MAFPTTSLLDNFNGADELPIATNWTTPMYSDESAGPDRFGNQMDFTPGSAYWDLASFGPDCEAWITTIPAPPGTIEVRVRGQSVGGASSGGSYYSFRSSPAEWELAKFVTGTRTVLAGAGSWVPASGDGIGISCEGSTIKGFTRQGGVWSEVASAIDSAISLAGRIGVMADHGGQNADDFGGGTMIASSTVELLRGGSSLRW